MRRADREFSSLKKAGASMKETKIISQNYCPQAERDREGERNALR